MTPGGAEQLRKDWIREVRLSNRAIRLAKLMALPWPELAECPRCRRMRKIVKRAGGVLAAHRWRDPYGAMTSCPGSRTHPERVLPEPVDLWAIVAILEGKEVPLTPNEFFVACDDLVRSCSPGQVKAIDVSHLVDWYVKHDGNERGGALASVLSDGNVSDDFVARAFQWARESGDWLGVALGKVITGMAPVERKLIVLPEGAKKRKAK